MVKNKLDKISEEIAVCMKCRLQKNRNNTVPGEGPTNAKIMFIGEAPGKNEDLTGRPFIGRAGKLLDELLKISNLERKDVFITSVIKCRPPNNRKPKSDELNICINEWMHKQIKEINPKIIVILGGVALKNLLDINKIKEHHGKIINHNNKDYFITYHPAAGLRFPSIKDILKQDFENLGKIIIN